MLFISRPTLQHTTDACIVEVEIETYIINAPAPNNWNPTMPITETRIGLIGLTCPGCDCGSCVTESIRDIAKIDGVIHVRVDRMKKQIVVRHDHEDVQSDQITRLVEAKGIPLSYQPDAVQGRSS